MGSRIRVFLIVFFIAFGGAGAPRASSDEDPTARLDAWIQPLVEARDLAGTVVVRHRGVDLLARSYGWQDLEGTAAIDPSTRFGVGSITKQFTAATLMVLWDEGRVDLRAPITELLPELSPHHDITLHHLLTHQAGLVRDLPDSLPVDVSFLEILAAQPRLAEAGQASVYSNCGFGVIAEAIERIAGFPFEEVMRDRLLRPLALHDTDFWDGRPRGKDHADALDPDLGPARVALAPQVDMRRLRGAGDLLSTPRDLVKWLSALSEGELFSEEARTLLTTDHGDGRAYGFGVYTRGGRRVIGHDGVTNGFTAFAEWYPEEELVVAYAGNVRTYAFEWLETALPRLVLGGDLPVYPRVDGGSPGVDAGIVGRYRVHEALRLDITQVDSHLELKGTGGYPTPLLRIAVDRYWYRARFSSLEFVRNEEGDVTTMKWIDAHGSSFDIPRQAENPDREMR